MLKEEETHAFPYVPLTQLRAEGLGDFMETFSGSGTGEGGLYQFMCAGFYHALGRYYCIYSSFFFRNPTIPPTNIEKLTINAATTSLFSPSDWVNTGVSLNEGVAVKVAVQTGVGVGN